MGKLTVFNDAKELARANFTILEKTIDVKEIPVSNHDNICIHKKYLTIMGMDNMNCHLLGNKTSIVVDYKDEIIEYIGCIVKEKLEDGYVMEYSKEYSIQ